MRPGRVFSWLTVRVGRVYGCNKVGVRELDLEQYLGASYEADSQLKDRMTAKRKVDRKLLFY